MNVTSVVLLTSRKESVSLLDLLPEDFTVCESLKLTSAIFVSVVSIKPYLDADLPEIFEDLQDFVDSLWYPHEAQILIQEPGDEIFSTYFVYELSTETPSVRSIVANYPTVVLSQD